MAVVFPHTFKDGPGNVASGVQVMENLEALKTGIEAISFVSHKKIVETEEAVESTSFVRMPTVDEVTGLVLPANGLIAIGYQAMWAETVLNTAAATVFLGANEIKAAVTSKTAPQAGTEGVAVNVGEGSAGEFNTLTTRSGGLLNLKNPGYTGDVTTGQVLGAHAEGGVFYVFAAAGTYTVSIRFKSSSGKVKAKNRKLWAWVVE